MDQIEESYRRFVEDLVTDPNRMVFTFFHNAEYEGITFSMERKLTKDRMKRERIDIVLEDRRVDGAVDGKVDRLRIYVCPWETYQEKTFQLIEPDSNNANWDTVQPFYDHLIKVYHDWKGEEDRQWSHWSVRFIDYFGPRSFIPRESSFT